MSEEFRVLASVYRSLIDILREDGYTGADISSELKIDLSKLDTPQEMLTLEAITALWQLAYQSRGPTIGIQVGARVKMIDFQDVGIFLASTENVADWMKQMDRYSELFSNLGEVRTDVTGQGLEVQIIYAPDVPLKFERLEFIALIIYNLASQFLDSPLKLECIELTRPKPEDPAPWEAAFNGKVKWAAGVTKYVIGKEEAERPILTRNPQMKKDFQLLLNNRLKESRKESPLVAIRAEVMKQLHDGASIESVASAMHLSVRSLQRRLEQAGYSFSKLLSEIREEMARHYLDLGAPVAEVATMLGYSEISGFNKAFKRWVGQSPAEYLEAHVEASRPAP